MIQSKETMISIDKTKNEEKRKHIDLNKNKKRKKEIRNNPSSKKKKKSGIFNLSEIHQLNEKISFESPLVGANPFSDNNIKEFPIEFSNLPISQNTLSALTLNHYTKMTDIQRSSIPHSLCGRDVFASAVTGSGKTLAYLVPILELLYRNQFIPSNGLGGIIIVPTRELAIQVFEVLKKIGKNHFFSCGLIIGGHDFNLEKKKIITMNILIATPGRLLQHFEETPFFDASNLQVLILDEVDRILDLGFYQNIITILEYLPSEHQTLVFSATALKIYDKIQSINLNNPEMIILQDIEKDHQILNSTSFTLSVPSKLHQYYMITYHHEKLNQIYSFIKTHLNSKILIFFSTCRQVQFLFQIFRKLRPGTPVMALSGKMKQNQRIKVFYNYLHKNASILMATDIAARGLDIPNVDWVIQYDCPNDIESYIHRIGRTARYFGEGHSLLFLDPSERTFLHSLSHHKLSLNRVKPNQKKIRDVSNKCSSLIIQDFTGQLKYLAEKCIISFVRSIHFSTNKKVFNINNINIPLICNSYGLFSIPEISLDHNNNKNKSRKLLKIESKLPKQEKNIQNKQKNETLNSSSVDSNIFSLSPQSPLSSAFQQYCQQLSEDFVKEDQFDKKVSQNKMRDRKLQKKIKAKEKVY